MRRGLVVAGVVVAGLLIGGAQLWQGQARAEGDGAPAELPEVKAILTSAPAVRPPVDRRQREGDRRPRPHGGERHAGRWRPVHVLDSAGPSGPFVRVRVGDLVQIRLNAAKTCTPDSIDLHAVARAGGWRGGHAARTGPGRRLRVQGAEPRALRLITARPECAGHIANGMYGLILVEGPFPGGPRVLRHPGRVLHQGQDAGPRTPGDRPRLTAERPEYVVSKRMGALLDDGVVKANVGETVRLFVGNGGPNLDFPST